MGSPFLVALLVVSLVRGGSAAVTVSGELRKWHRVTLTFDGPRGYTETSTPNPFADCRLDVTFSSATKSYLVPGFYAADGNAENTGASSGNKWRVHFAPDEATTWTWSASFVTGTDIAINRATAGTPHASIHGLTGSFVVQQSNKKGRDHRYHGRLNYVGERYLRFADSGKYFMKVGPDSPETYLVYDDFDGTPDLQRKSWSAHVQDFEEGDPTWMGGKGKGIIGAVNYVSDKGMNVQSFITMNLRGYGRGAYVFISSNLNDTKITDDDFKRFDVSKLAQWEIVFEHMDRKGLFLHFKTQEHHNADLLTLDERFLYYRELVARFSHHLALNWNIGEENTNTPEERLQFAWEFRTLDCYNHTIVLHTFPWRYNEGFLPILEDFNRTGDSPYTGFSFQIHIGNLQGFLETWLERTTAVGRPMVMSVDELGPWRYGVYPDVNTTDHDDRRERFLWSAMMSGAMTETYFGFDFECNDINCEDLRSRDVWWDQCRYAREFFEKYIRFWKGAPARELSSTEEDLVFRVPGETIAVYMGIHRDNTTIDLDREIPGPDFDVNAPIPNSTIDLTGERGSFRLSWYDPKVGGPLTQTTQTCLAGGQSHYLTAPSIQDWVALLQAGCQETVTQPAAFPQKVNPAVQMMPKAGTCGYHLEQGQVPTCGRMDFMIGDERPVARVRLTLSDGRLVIRTRVRSNFWISKIKTGVFRHFSADKRSLVPTRRWSKQAQIRRIYVDPLSVPSSNNCCGENLQVPFWLTYCHLRNGTCQETEKRIFKILLKCKGGCTALFGPGESCGVCE